MVLNEKKNGGYLKRCGRYCAFSFDKIASCLAKKSFGIFQILHIQISFSFSSDRHPKELTKRLQASPRSEKCAKLKKIASSLNLLMEKFQIFIL